MYKKAKEKKALVLEKAKLEFLENGFINASMRHIAKESGVTTGAIYSYFPDKNAIFTELVQNAVAGLSCLHSQQQEKLHNMIDPDYSASSELTIESMYLMLDYIYANRDSFDLLIRCSEGSAYADYIHSLIEKETESTVDYIGKIKKKYNSDYKVSKSFIHIISSLIISAVSEMIIHQVPYEDAKVSLAQVGAFYIAGWEDLRKSISDGGKK